tara:strand:+ start:363 stop:2228 length:1866 start_codon:yes stop_codon:yes gene_type:complete
MTIYYYDFSASSDGSGTWASPFNGLTEISGAPQDGDEIRVKSHLIADLTDFTFTGSFTIDNTNWSTPYLEVSDASLFTVGDICMSDLTKTCFRVKSIDTVSTPNKIFTGTTSCFWPIYDWSITNGAFRRIDPAYYPNSYPTNIYMGYATDGFSTNTITVSDGWYSETQRVTDKSYMTIIGRAQTSNIGLSWYLSNYGDGSTVNLTNTCAVAQWDNDFMIRDVFAYGVNITMNFHNLWGGRYNGGFYPSATAAAKAQNSNCSLTVDYLTTFYGFTGSSGWTGDGVTLQVNNHFMRSSYMNTRDNSPATNITFIQGNVWTEQNSFVFFDFSYSNEWTYQFNGPVESIYNSTMGAFVFGAKQITLGSGFSISKNHRVPGSEIAQTTVDKGIEQSTAYSMNYNFLSATDRITNNSSLTITQPHYFAFVHQSYQSNREAAVTAPIHDGSLIFDSSKTTILTTAFPIKASILVVDRNASAPDEYEILNGSYVSSTYYFKITKDTSYYKTTSPSLKCYLQTYNSSYNQMDHVKAINIPVDGDNSTEFTVTGWVKSDAGLFDQDKLKARVVYDGYQTVTQNINITNAEAGWVQFSLAFTPNDKQIAQFQLRMWPKAGAKSVWLSDVAVS